MLTLSWDESIGENHSKAVPKWVFDASLMNVGLKPNRESMHELSARGDNIGVEVPRIISLAFVKGDLVLPVRLDFGLSLFLRLGVFRSAESPGPLLVLLRTWGHSIDGEVEHVFGLYNADDFVCVQVDCFEDFLLALGLGSSLGVSAGMDNTVHVKVKVVHLRVILLHLILLFFNV